VIQKHTVQRTDERCDTWD